MGDKVKFDSIIRRLQAADLADLKIIEDMSYELVMLMMILKLRTR